MDQFGFGKYRKVGADPKMMPAGWREYWQDVFAGRAPTAAELDKRRRDRNNAYYRANKAGILAQRRARRQERKDNEPLSARRDRLRASLALRRLVRRQGDEARDAHILRGFTPAQVDEYYAVRKRLLARERYEARKRDREDERPLVRRVRVREAPPPVLYAKDEAVRKKLIAADKRAYRIAKRNRPAAAPRFRRVLNVPKTPRVPPKRKRITPEQRAFMDDNEPLSSKLVRYQDRRARMTTKARVARDASLNRSRSRSKTVSVSPSRASSSSSVMARLRSMVPGRVVTRPPSIARIRPSASPSATPSPQRSSKSARRRISFSREPSPARSASRLAPGYSESSSGPPARVRNPPGEFMAPHKKKPAYKKPSLQAPSFKRVPNRSTRVAESRTKSRSRSRSRSSSASRPPGFNAGMFAPSRYFSRSTSRSPSPAPTIGPTGKAPRSGLLPKPSLSSLLASSSAPVQSSFSFVVPPSLAGPPISMPPPAAVPLRRSARLQKGQGGRGGYARVPDRNNYPHATPFARVRGF